MKATYARNTALLVAGMIVGVLAIQFLWPRSGEAQGPPEFVVQAQVPDHAGQERIFTPVRPDLGPARLQEISRAFEMQGTAAARQGVLALDQGGKSLRVMPESGAMSYRNEGAFNGEPSQKNLPNPNQVAAQVDRQLRQANLLPREAQRSGAEVVNMERQNAAGGQVQSMAQEIHVNYRFRLGGKDVEGPGAKATAIVGEGGQVIGFDKSWREVEAGRQVRTRSGQDAIGQLRQKGNWNMLRQAGGNVRRVRITRARASYWANDLGARGGLLDAVKPAYIFEGTLQRADGEEIPFMQVVSAVEGETENLPASPAQPPRPQE